MHEAIRTNAATLNLQLIVTVAVTKQEANYIFTGLNI